MCSIVRPASDGFDLKKLCERSNDLSGPVQSNSSRVYRSDGTGLVCSERFPNQEATIVLGPVTANTEEPHARRSDGCAALRATGKNRLNDRFPVLQLCGWANW